MCIEYLEKNINFSKNVYSKELYTTLMNWRRDNVLSKESLRLFPKIFFSLCKGIIDMCDEIFFQDIIANNLFDCKKYFFELPIGYPSLMILKAIKFGDTCLCSMITNAFKEYFENDFLASSALQFCRLDYIKFTIAYNHKCCNGNLHNWLTYLCKLNRENDAIYLLKKNFPDDKIKFDNISEEGLLVYACINNMKKLVPLIIDHDPNEIIVIGNTRETALNNCIKNGMLKEAIYLVDKMEKHVINLWDRDGGGRHNALTLAMEYISDNPLKYILVDKLLLE
jgi:pentatricopeptide repeat protein